jgi:hypothetical protein
MRISRRDVLKLTGAGAAMALRPGTGLAGAVSAAPIAGATAGGPLYAVVSPGKAWGVFSGYHEAYHHAAMIRHSGAVCTSHVRCTPAVAEQIRQGTLGSFVELDGWAVPANEAEKRGIDFLKRALDRARVRNQLHRHHVETALRRVQARDAARGDVGFYVSVVDAPGATARIAAVAAERADAERSAEASGAGAQVHAASPDLCLALQWHLDDGGEELPDIIKHTARHMMHDEHQARLNDDPLYRLALDAPHPEREAARSGHTLIAYGRADRWLYATGADEDEAIARAAWSLAYRDNPHLLTMKASPALVRAVQRKGLEAPGFWHVASGIARHESELPMPRRASGSSSHAIRPPKPEWKR